MLIGVVPIEELQLTIASLIVCTLLVLLAVGMFLTAWELCKMSCQRRK